MGKRLKSSRYITGFDGLRTLAVIGVILYHILPQSLPGGFLGVPIFFVVSGYLITDLLIQEKEERGFISIKDFYLRRFRRLYPALLTMVLVSSAYITLFQRNLLVNIRGIILSNVFYVYNWFQIKHHESYFAHFGGESPFTHLWSLSIEGQFYLLWPLLVILLLALIKKKGTIALVIFLGAFISALEMALLYHGGDPSRLYYGTDTRMFAILIGAALAFVWPSTKLRTQVNIGHRRFLDGIGTFALAGIILSFIFASAQAPGIYHMGMFFFSILSALLVAIVAHPGGDFNRLFTNPLFTWIGKRSYGIYLYQFPVMIFYESKVKVGNHPILNAIIEIALILVISELSYRYLERPLQFFDYRQTLSVIREAFRKDTMHMTRRYALSVAGLVVMVALVGALTQPKPNQMQANPVQTTIAKNQAQTKKNNQTKKKPSKKVQANLEKQLTQAQISQAQNLSLTAVGDSVLAATSPSLQDIFPQMYVDAQVGRQVYMVPDVLKNLQAQGHLADTVLLVEGTNGAFNEEQLAQIMDVLGKRQVYWVNVHVPTKSWQNSVNKGIKEAGRKYPNIHVINWYDYSNGHESWFYNDDVHPNKVGTDKFANLVAQKILK